MTSLRVCSSREEWAAAAAADIAGDLRRAIAERGRAGIILSGGATPAAVYARLATAALDWGRVTVALTDERWVPADHPDSNEAMIRRLLLTGPAAAATLIGHYAPGLDPAAGAAALEQRLTGPGLAAGQTPWDVTVLGMGDDGHTASLFPGGDNLAAALDPATTRRCLPMRAPGLATARTTLTLRELLDARRVVMLLTGESKRRTLDRALGDGPVEDAPARGALRQDRVPATVYWAA